MSDVVLSAGVRQNLLALQSTANLMSITQNRLATGKKVNSALDNPGNFFTSQSLNNRASDLNALLDSIGQAQKTLEAADQGITSLTKLVESAKSVAKQALQAPQPGSATYNAVALTGAATQEVLGTTGDGTALTVANNQTYSFELNINGGGTNQGTATVGSPNSTRTSLQADFNNVLTQIDALAGDASYNGVNLLAGDDLKVVFNETGTSSLTITGVTYDAAGLGLTTVAGAGFQSDGDIDTVITKLDTALSSLRTQASKFGSNLSTVQTRQDFTKNLINTLQTGADNLVLADTNEEGANMLALQTRQQLSTTALSLSAQADQAVLRLFG